MRKLFGTDGIRGVANIEPMTGEMAMKLGRAAAYIFKNKTGRHRIVIGKDTRLSGYMLESALTSGICSIGVDVLLIGPLPTPGIAFITRALRADAGVVISASHNPYEDNGIKFFSEDGFKLPDDLELEIEKLIFSGKIDSIRPTAKDMGKAYRINDAEGRYIEFAKNSIPKGMDFEGMKIVLDCANGAAYKVAPMMLRELGAEVAAIGIEPSGMNINDGCGSLYPKKLQELVLEKKADIGIAYDGDADRAIFSDELGREANGDQIMAMSAIEMKKQGRLKNNTLVTTVMSNMGLDIAMKEADINVIKTKVGDRYVLEEMVKNDCNLGGEQSGHIIHLDYNTTGDGIITTLQILALMNNTKKKLSELSSCMTIFPQVLLNVRVKEKKEFSSIPEVSKVIKNCEDQLKDRGRILVRYSGTEPVARVMIEGESEGKIKIMAEEIAGTIKEAIG
ncbi:MAG: phosphoglucosamine mutase [Nitrospirae bacterium RBG_19FT_COMBO_42_15]|nr:MAG: phosphoglucosamine mutase [Nitrospirae bacterium RBG_19FT_COMBO_42_15]